MSAHIIGADEVGYGAWSGPLYVCAVVALKSWKGPSGLTDSKALFAEERWALYPALQTLPMALISVSVEHIDKVGVKKALLEAHYTAISTLLKLFPDADVVVDGVLPVPGLPQANPIPKADALFPTVSAASVIAKVNRDAFMVELHKEYPWYGWATNGGYGTSLHREGLASHGVCRWHRRSYAPIREILEKKK